MFLTTVSIRNFRNITDVTVRLNKGLTVIVGENNSGKTAIIDAVRIALGASSQGIGTRIWAKSEDLCRATGAQSFDVQLVYTEPSDDERAQFVECLSQDCSEIVIHYRWSWNAATERYFEQRWGQYEESNVPAEILQALPFVYLEPLRDALANLQAGRSSRVGALMRRMDRRRGADMGAAAKRIEAILTAANDQLESDDLVKQVVKVISDNLVQIERDLCQNVALAASEQRFASIVNGLCLKLIGEAPTFARFDIAENGLGYNNLLYVATVLADLANCVDGDVPVLCIEEPEAHLHPQLQLLLADYLRDIAAHHGVQVIVTTHSPNLVSHVGADSIVVLPATRITDGKRTAISLRDCGLTELEKRSLERLMDVTKASLLFAKSVILVEGVCEQYLLPALVRHVGGMLEGRGISIIPIHGVGFATITKLFGEGRLPGKCAVITDSDPGKEVRGMPLLPEFRWGYHKVYPKSGNSNAQDADALAFYDEDPAVVREKDNVAVGDYVRVFKADVTLEYDLALAGENASVIARTWRETGIEGVLDLTEENMARLPDNVSRAIFTWQSVCIANGGKYKARLAQALAGRIIDGSDSRIALPGYLRHALEYVGSVKATPAVMQTPSGPA